MIRKDLHGGSEKIILMTGTEKVLTLEIVQIPG